MKIKRKHKKQIKEVLITVFGNLLLAFSVSFFFINYKGNYVYGYDSVYNYIKSLQIDGILVGGTSGFSLIIRNLFFSHLENSEFVVETIITVTTWLFFFLGLIFLGKKFALHTLLSTITYPIFIYFFGLSIFDEVHEQINLFSPIICACVGGFIMGWGCGIVYKIGGSTGGFDIPGVIINKFTRVKLSIIFFCMDGLLVALALIANFTLYEIVIGLISVGMYSFAVELAQKIGQEAYLCDIVSDKWEEISKDIIYQLDRGTTLVDVKGGYTRANHMMIKTMIAKSQYLQVLDIVKKHDPNAFMCVSKTYDIFGEGYTDLKSFLNK